jgi:hypothetical protein
VFGGSDGCGLGEGKRVPARVGTCSVRTYWTNLSIDGI